MNKILLSLALLGVTSSVPVFAQGAAKPVAATGVAAEVNGEKIMMVDLTRIIDSIKQSEPAFKQNTPETQKALAEIRVQLLDELIATKLLAQEAKKRKITANTSEVDAAVKSFREGNFKTDAEFQTWLKSDGKTSADLKRIIGDELAIRELSKQLASDVTVSNQDIGEYYRANLEQFTIPEGVKARHILLAINPNAPAAEKKRVKDRAETLKKQAQNGDFAALAKNNSDDPSNKDKGGDLGAFTRGTMVKAFEDAAFGAKVGQVVGPIETPFGMHIIKVDEKIAKRVLPLSEVQGNPRLKAVLLKQKVQKRLDERINEFKSKSKIQKFV